jgi:GNAT superfamily N-acetyltransferase
MSRDGYEIVPFNPGFRDGVLALLKDLWGPADESNRAYFEWKYERNPYVDEVLGLVALHSGEVIGFRGYFALRWQVAARGEQHTFLCPSDTNVRADHRRRGVSVLMGRMALDRYGQRFPVLVNFSASSNSVPGYLRLGFVPVCSKAYLDRYDWLGLLGYAVTGRTKSHPGSDALGSRESWDVEVSLTPRPDPMEELTSRFPDPGSQLSLKRDSAFFRWRFQNPRNRYVFYFSREGDDFTGYIAVRVAQRPGRGFIVDYAGEEGVLARVLRRIARARHFDVLSVPAYAARGAGGHVFPEGGFRRNTLFGRLERGVNGEWPILVRPTRGRVSEDDFVIAGLDVRRPECWSLREICSDHA